jgi:hypothetical protein
VAQRTANVADKAIARFLGKSRETDATGDGAADFASRVGVTVARGFVRIPCFSGPAHEVKLTPDQSIDAASQSPVQCCFVLETKMIFSPIGSWLRNKYPHHRFG